MKHFYLVSLLILWSPKTLALDTFLEGQVGAMTGLFHVSYGATFSEKHSVSLGVGYVPHFSFHEKMFLVSAKYQYWGATTFSLPFIETNTVVRPFNFAISTITGFSDDIYRKNPDHIPGGYYVPTARRLLFSYQPSFELDTKTQAYMSLTMLDVGLINYIRNFDFYTENYHYMGLEGVMSFGFGIRKQY